MNINALRQENLKRLVAMSETQAKLADELKHETLGQRRISYIVRGEKRLRDSEARYIEAKLFIPAGWIDKYLFDLKIMALIRKFRGLDLQSQEIANKLMRFVEKNK